MSEHGLALDSFSRLLQEAQGRNFNQFAAFLFWYLLLLLCCAIPTVCAYRRRNRMHHRQARLDHIQRMAANGVVILGTSMPDAEETEEARAAKLKKVEAAIKETTFMVKSSDLLTKQESQLADEEAPAVTMENASLEDPNNEPSEFAALRLNSAHPNGANREVPASCAICLCVYETDDAVTFSPNEACQHAFHKECISAWIAKKEKPLCPCCRQDFCTLESGEGQQGQPGQPQRNSARTTSRNA